MKYKIIFFVIMLVFAVVGYVQDADKKKDKGLFSVKKEKTYEWYASGNAPSLYPTELFFGDFVFKNGKRLYIPLSTPFGNVWGRAGGTHILNNNNHPVPVKLDMIYYSFVENKFYSLEAELPQEKIEELLSRTNKDGEPKYETLVAGMAPYGGVAVWASGGGDVEEIAWLHAKETTVDRDDFFYDSNYEGSMEEYGREVLKNKKNAYDNFLANGLPPKDLFDNYMKKYNYKITLSFDNKKIVLTELRTRYFNGEIFEDTKKSLSTMRPRAKLSKISIYWEDLEDKYNIHIWPNEKEILEVFNKAYGDATEQEGELLLEIDNADMEKGLSYDLALKTPSGKIPLHEQEVILFKNSWSFRSSDNYNRPEGGWRN